MQKRRWMTLVGVLVAILSLALFAAACNDDDDDGVADPTAVDQPTEPVDVDEPTEPADGNGAGASIDVSLAEFTVTPSEDSADAGALTFSTMNDGAIPHNLKVIATDLAADALPLDDTDQAVDETAVEVVASSADLDAGASEDLLADLEAGSYVLICNIATHYTAGMTVAFTVN